MPHTKGLFVGVTGKKRAGKDTFAAALIEQRAFTRIAFADPLRDSLYAMNPFIGNQSYPGHLAPSWPVRLRDYVDALGWHYAKDDPEVRRLLQEHGVAMRNHADPEVWVNAAMRKASPILEAGRGVVITDVRFPNEAVAVKRAGGVLVRINRLGVDTTDQHISEIALDDWAMDAEILNNGSITELWSIATQLVDNWE